MISVPPLPPGQDMPKLGRQPVLDGIRGVAVLVVLGHNLNWAWLRGGFFGVDLFFALSGFLITTLLLEDHARHGRIALGYFFARRFLRLYPALVALVICSVVMGLVTHPPVATPRIAAVATAVLGYGSNWLLISDPQAWFGGMGHTWSLSVEIHFYVLWALLVAAVTSRRGLDWRTLAMLALGLAAASAGWRAICWEPALEAVRWYAGTDMRLDAVFLGAGAGVLRGFHLSTRGPRVLPELGPGIVRGMEMACVSLLLALIILVPQQSPLAYLGGFAVAGATSAVLILLALLYKGSLVAPVASFPVLVWFGQISYSLYLWHLPVAKVFTVDRLAPIVGSPVLVELVRAGVSIAVAAGSYYSIERYFLRIKSRFYT